MKDAKFSVAAVLVIVATLTAPGAPAQNAESPAAETPSVAIAFGTGIDREARQLVGEAAVFGPDHESIFCLTRIMGLTPPANVTHAWYYEGKTMARVDLKVGSPDWRTWSSKRYLPAWTGQWEVKVLDPNGRVLATGGFEIRSDGQEDDQVDDQD
jgi:hypothetical protein